MTTVRSLFSVEDSLELLLCGELAPAVAHVVPDPVGGDGSVQHRAGQSESVKQRQRTRGQVGAQSPIQIQGLKAKKMVDESSL